MAELNPSPKKSRGLIGSEMVKEGLITPKQLEFALEEQLKLGKDKEELLGEIMLKAGFINESALIKFLEEYLGVPYASLRRKGDIDLFAVRMIPEKMARNFKVIPVAFDAKTNKLIIAMANPFDLVALDTLQTKTGYRIEKRFSFTKGIEEAIDKAYSEEIMQKSVTEFVDFKTAELKAVEEKKEKTGKEQLEAEAVKTPVIQFVDSLLKSAIQKNASDIHIEPQEDRLSIRFRIDGLLQNAMPSPKEMQSAVITRVKLLGNMDIAEQRLPQDGRFKVEFKGKNIDIRLASVPTIYGEKLVMRILDSSTLMVKMEDLGITAKDIEEFKSILVQPYGMILVTGPTGSGKTTTLYSALSYINTPDKNIVTIEDPVEYQIKGINQIQVKQQIGLTFSLGLRTVLRQDPDIIMIGEIRDLETLENAVKASLTGHLVLSTIHTNDAPSVVLRLMHMGLEPYLISACVNLIIAQRLVRKICEFCKEKTTIKPSMLQALGKRSNINLANMSFYQGKGCERCDNTGYKGRTGLYEFLPASKKMKETIVEGNVKEEELRKVAQQAGMKTIFQHGLEKVNQGITTMEEVLRVTVLEKISEKE